MAGFAAAFTFARAVAAQVRNSAGALVTVGADVPRFDHSPAGVRRGLLVEAGETLGQGDRCRAIAGAWEVTGPATVLHEYEDGAGAIVRRAAYTVACRATVDAMLSVAGRHRTIGVVPGHLRNRGGYVRYHELDWPLPAALGTGVAANEVVSDGAATDRPLIGG